jgi:hypothetical protein
MEKYMCVFILITITKAIYFLYLELTVFEEEADKTGGL